MTVDSIIGTLLAMPSAEPQVPITPVSRAESIRDQTRDKLYRLIVEGAIGQGERLNEVTLASSLGISRGPLREAIQQLVAEGLLTAVASRGTFVPVFGSAEVKSLYEVREALEGMAARLAAGRVTADGAARLHGLLGDTAARLTDPCAAYPADLDFHEVILDLSGNAPLVVRARAVSSQLHIARQRSAFDPDHARTAYLEHTSVTEAILDHAADDAERLMRGHIQAAWKRISSSQKQPDGTS